MAQYRVVELPNGLFEPQYLYVRRGWFDLNPSGWYPFCEQYAPINCATREQAIRYCEAAKNGPGVVWEG